MRRSRPRHERQLHLFHKRDRGPGWQSLPARIRRSVTGLLAQMLIQHRNTIRRDQAGKAVTDE